MNLAEIGINFLTSSAGIAVIAAVIGFLVNAYLSETKWKKLYVITVSFFADQLEKDNIDAPKFLKRLIIKLHSINDDTKDAEYLLEDEIVKKSKGE